MNVVLLVKNGQDTIQSIIKSYSGHKMSIFVDDKTTDNTRDLVPNFQAISFKGFSITRNECLDKCYNTDYKWTMIIDDSYELVDNGIMDELDKLDKSIVCVSIIIKTGKMEYQSKRIIRTKSKLRYIGDIHENINFESQYLIKNAYINDVQCDNHKKRTLDRIDFDMSKLVNTDDRTLYYKAEYTHILYNNDRATLEQVIGAYKLRIANNSPDNEETFICLMRLGLLTRDLKYYIQAAIKFKNRAGEAWLYAYFLLGEPLFIERAYLHRKLGNHRLPCDTSIYDGCDGYNGLITKNYFMYRKKLVLVELVKVSRSLSWNI